MSIQTHSPHRSNNSQTLRAIYQNLLGLIIIGIILFIGLWLNPQGPQGPQGIYLPQVETVYAPTQPSSITLVNTLPKDSQVIGLINTSLHFNQLSTAQEQSLFNASLNKAKQLAASAGGNAIGLVQANAGGSAGSPLDTFSTQFLVIH